VFSPLVFVLIFDLCVQCFFLGKYRFQKVAAVDAALAQKLYTGTFLQPIQQQAVSIRKISAPQLYQSAYLCFLLLCDS
jgi:hypothetical protein